MTDQPKTNPYTLIALAMAAAAVLSTAALIVVALDLWLTYTAPDGPLPWRARRAGPEIWRDWPGLPPLARAARLADLTNRAIALALSTAALTIAAIAAAIKRALADDSPPPRKETNP